MAEFNETLVRRFFELDGFLVRTNVRYPVPNGYSDVDLLGLNPRTGDAVAVEVKGWHQEPLTMSTFTSWPNLLSFANDVATAAIQSILGERSFRRILVVSRLGSGSGDAVRAYLSRRDIEVLDFPAVLTRLMADANTNKNADSDAEHLLRLLRIYGYLAPPSE
jgi:hypothetical protein